MDEKLASQLQILLQNSNDATRSVILDGHLDEAMVVFVTTYHLTVDESVAVKNTILLTLLGVTPTKLFKEEIAKDALSLDEASLESLIKDIDLGVFERARLALFGEEYEEGQEIKKLTLGEDESDDALREQIMANTDRDSAIKVSPLEALKKKMEVKKDDSKKEDDVVPLVELVKRKGVEEVKAVVGDDKNIEAKTDTTTGVGEDSKETEKKSGPSMLPGSRSELLERLNILQSIPNSEQVGDRMKSIREQIEKMEQGREEEEKKADIEYAITSLKEKRLDAKKVIKEYLVDPYRELPD